MYTVEEPQEAFDWSLQDLIDRPPYDHYDMVIALAEGKFIVEGKVSNWNTADTYAHNNADEPEVWKALRALDEDIAVNGKIPW